MTENGYIRVHRSIVSWEWWEDINTFRVFMWLLLSANWQDARFMGHEVPKGTLITSLQHLANETNLSVRNVRTALKHLESTGEVTIKSTSRFSLITIKNYCLYQEDDKPSDKQVTRRRQTTDKRVTTIEKEEKEEKEKKEKKEENTYLELITEMNFSDQINAVVTEWLRYKQEKKQTYQKSGFKQLLNAISRDIENNGEDHVINCFRYSMTNNYSGVFFDRKEEDNGKPKGEAAPVKRDEYREWMHQQLNRVSEV